MNKHDIVGAVAFVFAAYAFLAIFTSILMFLLYLKWLCDGQTPDPWGIWAMVPTGMTGVGSAWLAKELSRVDF